MNFALKAGAKVIKVFFHANFLSRKIRLYQVKSIKILEINRIFNVK